MDVACLDVWMSCRRAAALCNKWRYNRLMGEPSSEGVTPLPDFNLFAETFSFALRSSFRGFGLSFVVRAGLDEALF